MGHRDNQAPSVSPWPLTRCQGKTQRIHHARTCQPLIKSALSNVQATLPINGFLDSINHLGFVDGRGRPGHA